MKKQQEALSGVFTALSSVANETLHVGALLQVETNAYVVSKEENEETLQILRSH
ncbi:hypothetical protein NEFER03_1578 [Nematocida sp. LUAm3]|nr:hypothetical protein NEFER03_1578 [Nematocida sp. LUAm3]KAI5174654.1 hypothetical protein NEFER02_0764 [Nematocida sp. LUAm2]KAI5177785.1 hypothetical protein NEFER01_0987 [Nematocida sp. LUAm1]